MRKNARKKEREEREKVNARLREIGVPTPWQTAKEKRRRKRAMMAA